MKSKSHILFWLLTAAIQIYPENTELEKENSPKCGGPYYQCFNSHVTGGKTNAGADEKYLLKLFNIAFEVSLQSEIPDSLFLENFWEFYNSYLHQYPYSENIAQIQLSASALFLELGNVPRAKKVLEGLILNFDGSTRPGSLAFFYLSQIYYSENNFQLALKNLSSISNFLFLPINRDEYFRRRAEMEFRIVEEQQGRGELEEAKSKLIGILNMSLDANVKDSLQFHLAEINYTMGKQAESCRNLETLFLKPSKNHLRANAFYNFFQQRCKPSQGLNAEYQNNLKEILNLISWELDTSRKNLMAYGVADLILDSIYRPEQILRGKQIMDWEPKFYADIALYLFRNVTNINLQKSLSDLELPNDSIFTELSVKLRALQALYKCFYKIQDEGHCAPPDSTGLEHWEKSIWSYIRAVQFSKRISEDSLNYLDSARITFNYIGESNSELSFDAAQKVYEMYLWIAEDLEISGKGFYPEIGKLLVKLQYQQKAGTILDKIRQWEISLTRVNLASSSREIIDKLPAMYSKLEKLDNIHWNALNRVLNKMPSGIYSLEKEMALKILSQRIKPLAQESSLPYAKLSYLKSLLHWYYLGTDSSMVTSVYDKEAEVGHVILEYFLELEKEDLDSSWISFLGAGFYPHLYSKKPRECYYFTSSAGSLHCYPMTKSLPRPSDLDSLYARSQNAEAGEDPSNTRQNSALFYILCEQQKIRKLQSQLQAIQ